MSEQKSHSRSATRKLHGSGERITKEQVQQWADRQRRAYHDGTLSEYRIKKLKEIDFDFGEPPATSGS